MKKIIFLSILFCVSCNSIEPLKLKPTNNLGRYTITSKPVDSLKNTLVIEGQVLNVNTKQPTPTHGTLFAYLNLGDFKIDGDEDGRYRIELEEVYLNKYDNKVSLEASDVTGTFNFFVNITLDTGFLSNATDLNIARVLMHEILHAYITRSRQVDFLGSIAESLSDLITSRTAANPNSVQHILIVDRFVGTLATTLDRWHNKPAVDNDYYKFLSWGGLNQTPAYLTKPELFRTSALNAARAEGDVSIAYNPLNSQGVKNCL